MAIKIKFWVFRNYWWILLFLIIGTGVYAYQYQTDIKITFPILGALLSFFYFLQKQRLEEMRLFRKLFTDFNSRYDKMNEKLGKIIKNNQGGDLKKDETQTIVDYFNLCAEEYLFYKQGYILPDVWMAWHNGMRIYLRNKNISDLWQKERKSESYYSLEFLFN